MRVYIAAPYGARTLVARRLSELQRIGFTVSCRWADGTHEVGPEGAATEVDEKTRASWAHDDLQDIRDADVLVVLSASEALGSEASTRGVSGGRHVETGYAIARRIPVVFVGEPENVFHAIPQVAVVPSWHEALIEMAHRVVEFHRTQASAEPKRVDGVIAS